MESSAATVALAGRNVTVIMQVAPGTSVPQDFVEAPSQMLENWPWDKKVLDSFAADYRDPNKKIPADVLAQLKTARFATYGTFYRRQLSRGTHVGFQTFLGQEARTTCLRCLCCNPISGQASPGLNPL